MAGAGKNGRRIGWDFAGTVEKSAANGLGAKEGTRVVGMLGAGSWAQRIAAPVESFAPLPDEVSFAQAATLPVAGLTALYGLEKATGLLGRRVLVTGGTGGVGHFGIQLARLGGAQVVATARSAEKAALLREAGAHQIVVGEDPQALGAHGPYDIILDGVGGPALAVATANLAKNGICVIYGATGGAEVSFNVQRFYATGGALLYGFILFHELLSTPASVGLARLASLVAQGKVRPLIDTEVPLSQISDLAQKLANRLFTGKAVVNF
jgi:NADPH2:quinone reductase